MKIENKNNQRKIETSYKKRSSISERVNSIRSKLEKVNPIFQKFKKYLDSFPEDVQTRMKKLCRIYEQNGLTGHEARRLIFLPRENIDLVLKLNFPNNGEKNDFDSLWNKIFI